MAFTASNLVQNILDELGQVDANFGLFDATGGSATTFVNSNFANFENPPEQDIFKNYLAIVVRDAGGAAALPEGQWAVCSAYNDATWTGTIATITAIASGDTIMLAKQDKFPLSQIIFSINRGLENLGDIPANFDTTSLTTVANQTEYSIPVAAKRGLKQIWIQGRTNNTVDNQWTQVIDRRNNPAIGGTANTIFIPQYPASRKIGLVYDGAHPVISAYSDVISEYIHPKVATSAAIIQLLQWYNRRDENQDAQSYFLWLENEYATKHLPMALMENPIWKPKRTPKYATFERPTIDRPPSPFL